MSQSAFSFDAPLTHEPVWQLPPKPVTPPVTSAEGEALVQAARNRRA